MSKRPSVRRSGSYSKVDAQTPLPQPRVRPGAIHDLRNLLFVIGSAAEVALKGVEGPGNAFEAITDIGVAAAMAIRLVEALETGERTSVTLAPVDLNEVVADFMSILRRQGGSRARIVLEAGTGDMRACIDPRALEHTLLNLVTNAVDATEEDGVVTIRLESLDVTEEGAATARAMTRVTVSDTASGMDAATLARAFEPRFTTKAAIGRSGLGLATVRGLIEESGGRITATSTVGVGTVFVIDLPAVEGP